LVEQARTASPWRLQEHGAKSLFLVRGGQRTGSLHNKVASHFAVFLRRVIAVLPDDNRQLLNAMPNCAPDLLCLPLTLGIAVLRSRNSYEGKIESGKRHQRKLCLSKAFNASLHRVGLPSVTQSSRSILTHPQLDSELVSNRSRKQKKFRVPPGRCRGGRVGKNIKG
jgi:hypothetical protein